MHYLIRHGETGGNRLNRANEGDRGLPLNPDGERQAALLHERLAEVGVDFRVPAAVSNQVRTQQTAELAGFSTFVVNRFLGEVPTDEPERYVDDIKRGQVPHEAIEAALKLFENPPVEQICFTHGGLIMGAFALQSPAESLYMPPFGSITPISLRL